jgi:hypothetical protein
MLVFLFGLLSLALLLAVARQRAEIARLRAERRLARITRGSWEAFHRPPAALSALGWWPGRDGASR